VQGPHIEKIPILDTTQGQVLNCEKTLYLQDGAQIHLRVHFMFLYTHNYQSSNDPFAPNHQHFIPKIE
jgi:hypothetical protein